MEKYRLGGYHPVAIDDSLNSADALYESLAAVIIPLYGSSRM